MTDHDQRDCLRCGDPAGDSRFCEACRSQLDSFLENPTRGAAHASDAVYSAAPAAWEIRLERAVAAGDTDNGLIAPHASAAGGDDEAKPRANEGVNVELGRGALEPDASVTGAERAPLGPGVARFEELLTPKIERELVDYREADAAGDACGATNLGVVLEQKGDLEGALAAYRRGDERGDVNASFNLGCLLAELGDLTGAEAALQRADERGDASGASNLGVLLQQQGDLEGALAAYRRADERGDAYGAFNLGLLLAARGDLAGARAAYLRATERGDADVRVQVRTELDALPAEVDPPGPIRDPGPAPGAVGDPEPAVDAATSVPPPEPSVAPAPEARTGAEARTSRTGWLVALCVLGLLGLLVVRALRARRRSN